MDYTAQVQVGEKRQQQGLEKGRGGRTLAAVGTALVLACGLVTGCDEPSSPRGAVQRAAQALLDDDHSALLASLNGAALKRYGDREGAQALAHILKGRDLELSPAMLRYRDERTSGFDSLRIYSVPVIDKARGAIALEATVTCSVHWISRDGYAYRDPVPELPRSSQQPTAGYTPVESCRVSDVKLGGEAPAASDTLCQSDPEAEPAPGAAVTDRTRCG